MDLALSRPKWFKQKALIILFISMHSVWPCEVDSLAIVHHVVCSLCAVLSAGPPTAEHSGTHH